MSTKKSIIPEFMKDDPNDIFQFLFRLKVVLDGVVYKFIVFGNHLEKDFL